jgi:hypothetical protein
VPRKGRAELGSLGSSRSAIWGPIVRLAVSHHVLQSSSLSIRLSPLVGEGHLMAGTLWLGLCSQGQVIQGQVIQGQVILRDVFRYAHWVVVIPEPAMAS